MKRDYENGLDQDKEDIIDSITEQIKSTEYKIESLKRNDKWLDDEKKYYSKLFQMDVPTYISSKSFDISKISNFELFNKIQNYSITIETSKNSEWIFKETKLHVPLIPIPSVQNIPNAATKNIIHCSSTDDESVETIIIESCNNRNKGVLLYCRIKEVTQNDVVNIGSKYPILFYNHKAYLPDLSPYCEEFRKKEIIDIANYKIIGCVIINSDNTRKCMKARFKTAMIPDTSKAVVGAEISKMRMYN